MKFEFSRQVFEKVSNIKFHQIHPVGAELFHADRRTDMTKLIVAFRNLGTRLKSLQNKMFRGRYKATPSSGQNDHWFYRALRAIAVSIKAAV